MSSVSNKKDDDYENDSIHHSVRSGFEFYRSFKAWVPNRSWNVELPAGEDTECEAAGADIRALTISPLCVRVYKAGGADYVVARLPGRVANMYERTSRPAIVYEDDDAGGG